MDDVGVDNAMAMLKKMGVNVEGYELEAKEIWNQLNSLSQSNPIEYNNFIEQACKGSNEPDLKSFRPEKGFCIKTISLKGDGKKIRDNTQNDGSICYINFCSYKGITSANINNKPVGIDILTSSTADIEVPLSIGKSRRVDVNGVDAIVMDVIVHSTVIKAALASSGYFKKNIIQLAIDSIHAETGLLLQSKVIELPSSQPYVGGLGPAKDAPVLFFIESATEQDTPHKGDITLTSIINHLDQPSIDSTAINDITLTKDSPTAGSSSSSMQSQVVFTSAQPAAITERLTQAKVANNNAETARPPIESASSSAGRKVAPAKIVEIEVSHRLCSMYLRICNVLSLLTV